MAERGLPLSIFLVILVLVGCPGRVQKPPPQLTPPSRVMTSAPSVAIPAPTVAPPSADTAPETKGIPKPGAALVRLRAEEIPFFSDDMDLASLEAALEKSLEFYLRAAGNGPRRMDDSVVTVRDMQESITALREILRLDEPDEVKQTRIKEAFDVYRSTGLDGKNTVLFTGYFEPIMNGSLKKSERYKYPIYRAPDDAIVVNLGRFGEQYPRDQLIGRVNNRELIPYYSRSEIDDLGALADRSLELAWVDDRIGLFFLHTQGSGKIRLPNGTLLQIGYALKNGRPFQSLARFLMDTGKISSRQISYQSIKRYLRERPEDLSEILGHNESFVFFREVSEGPVGSIGVILTAGRSIATDAAVFPRGALAFMRARKPVFDAEGQITAWVPFTRFVVSQDAGGAIKGAGRVDLFCGTGDEAEMLAGSMAERGELYFLVKKRPNGPSTVGEVRR